MASVRTRPGDGEGATRGKPNSLIGSVFRLGEAESSCNGLNGIFTLEMWPNRERLSPMSSTLPRSRSARTAAELVPIAGHGASDRGYAEFREFIFRDCLENSWTDSQSST
jgi:hypothetical protein